jgi:hypothetical protein
MNNEKKNMQNKEFNSYSKEEQVLKEIFSKTKIEYINEHFLEFNFEDKSLLIFDDLNNNVTFDIEIIYDEFKNHGIDTKLNENEISEKIKKLMNELFNIDNLNHITPNRVF